MGKTTSFSWQYRDIHVTVEMPNALSPEAVETVLTRTRREFIAAARQLGMGKVDVDAVETSDDT